MAGELFKKAAAYRKKYKGMSMPEAVKAVSKKAAPVRKHKAIGKARPKAVPIHKRLKTKVRIKKSANPSITIGKAKQGISGISLNKIDVELQHQEALKSNIMHHQALLKEKGQTAKDKAGIRADIAKYKSCLAASKKYVTSLKKSL
jgi:hypothetical protein